MFARGPQPGGTPKTDALQFLPAGTTCVRVRGAGMTAYVVNLPNGLQIASGGNSATAWGNAHGWGLRNPPLPTQQRYKIIISTQKYDKRATHACTDKSLDAGKAFRDFPCQRNRDQ